MYMFNYWLLIMLHVPTFLSYFPASKILGFIVQNISAERLLHLWFDNFWRLCATQRETVSPRSWRWSGSETAWGVWADCRASCSWGCTRDSGGRLWPPSVAACCCCTGTGRKDRRRAWDSPMMLFWLSEASNQAKTKNDRTTTKANRTS